MFTYSYYGTFEDPVDLGLNFKKNSLKKKKLSYIIKYNSDQNKKKVTNNKKSTYKINK